MKVAKLIEESRNELARQWCEAVFASYAEKTQGFLRGNSDPFTNPMGSMIHEAADILITALANEDCSIEQVKQALDRFIKIRAVQQFTPSQSVGVLYLLKPILRSLILPKMEKGRLLKEYLELEARLDSLVLLAFDLYCKDRETLSEIRIKEIRNQYAQLKKWAQQLNSEAPLGTFVGCGN